MSEKRHPGYVLGNHWLQTAYERICAGEAEADVLADYGVTRTDQPSDALREARIAAYRQGALDVHQNYQPDRDPDFTEAAHDYVASIADQQTTLQPDAARGDVYPPAVRSRAHWDAKRDAEIQSLKDEIKSLRAAADQQSGCPACGNGCYSPERGCADGKCRMYKAPNQQPGLLPCGCYPTEHSWGGTGPRPRQADKPSGA
jgi:hypothetical protein